MITSPINKPLHLAIIDDQPTFTSALAFSLKVIGNHITDFQATNGQQLLNKLAEAKTLPDVCLLDISMPVMNGYQALHAIRKKYPTIKVIMLSQFYGEYSIIKSLRIGAHCCIPKEIEIEDLSFIINEVATKGFYYTELVQELSKLPIEDAKKYDFTPRQLEFLGLICSDLTYKQIADVMNLQLCTVDGHRDELFAKTQLKSRTALAMFVLFTGIVHVNDKMSWRDDYVTLKPY